MEWPSLRKRFHTIFNRDDTKGRGKAKKRVHNFTLPLYEAVIDETIANISAEFAQEGIAG